MSEKPTEFCKKEGETMSSKHRPILALDFDGVLHRYDSGWQGPGTIPDPPVAGSLGWLIRAMEYFEIHIFSSRSRYIRGRWAMKRWLRKCLIEHGGRSWRNRLLLAGMETYDPWDTVVRNEARAVVRELHWPTRKPPAMVTIDDRALTFTGDWSDFDMRELQQFKPWNQRLEEDHDLD